MISAPYFTALGLMAIYLALRVITLRRKYKVGLGDGGIPELQRMIRVFGNFVEYVPFALVLIIGLEFVQSPRWFIHFTAVLLIAGRMLHAMGLSGSPGVTKGRFIGTVLTFLSIIFSSIGILIFSLTAPQI